MIAPLSFAQVGMIAYKLKAEDVMKSNFQFVPSDTAIGQIPELVKDRADDAIVFMDGDAVAGITELEEVKAWLACTPPDCLAADKVSPVKQILNHDTALMNIFHLFDLCGMRLPVLNSETGNVEGIIARCDIVLGILKAVQLLPDNDGGKPAEGNVLSSFKADKVSLNLSYNIKSGNFDRAGEASMQIKKTLQWLGMDPKLIQRASIIAYEAEMNMVIYAEDGCLSFEVSPERLIMTAKDNGPGIEDIDKAMQPGFSTAPGWVREMGFGAGMGLQNIKSNADKMILESSKHTGTHLKTILEQV